MRAIYFGAEWCKSCVAVKPTFEKEMQRNKFKYNIIDVETAKGVDASCRYIVRNVPTIVVVDDSGKEVYRASGSTSTENVLKYLKQ